MKTQLDTPESSSSPQLVVAAIAPAWFTIRPVKCIMGDRPPLFPEQLRKQTAGTNVFKSVFLITEGSASLRVSESHI